MNPIPPGRKLPLSGYLRIHELGIRELAAAVLLSLTALSCSTTGGVGDQLGLSPYWDWKTIETEHFRVTFPSELQEIAEKSANYLEEANTTLSKHLHWTPRAHVQVLVIDNEDLANGLTSPEGRFGMVFYVTPPENWFSTSYYDDWLRLLAFHEYTHFLNMDTTRGFWAATRYIFGDVLLPNSLWPSWMLEGLAVWDETRYTHGGRGRSPFWEMILRSAVDENVLDTSHFITLDKVNGPNPYSPGGETAYLFGYELMNQVASDNGQEALGQMSYRSGKRFPYLINGNLENITNQDWYDFWDEFVHNTRKRQGIAIAKIKQQPLTRVDRLTTDAYQVLGSAASPDGKWLAFTQSRLDEITGLYLKNLQTGEVKRLEDKLLGIGMAFTPDSKQLVFSDLHRKSHYYIWNDLKVYDLERGSSYWISDSLRSRDPDVSRDGKSVIFTLIEHGKTQLALASLTSDGGELSLGKPEKIYIPAMYDNVSNPKFNLNGTKVFFSIHRNGKSAEDLMQLDLETHKVSELVANGFYNRFPALDSDGTLYFVSDMTGVDNIYRLTNGARPEQMTNVISGVWFPTFGQGGKLYASVYSSTGWDLAQVQLPEGRKALLNSGSLKVDPPPAPKTDAKSSPSGKDLTYPVENYSVWPSILPRGWTPELQSVTGGLYLAGFVSGFDATDRHRYILGGGYYTGLGVGDFVGLYSNRSLGPTLTLYSTYTVGTLGADVVGNQVTANTYVYSRDLNSSAVLSYPFLWTYSYLVPALAWNASRTFYYNQHLNPGIVNSSYFVPSADFSLTYSNAQTSRLAITQESGRTTVLGSRVYFDGQKQSWKELFSDTEYLRLTSHSVLVPSVNASYVSRASSTFLDANVAAQGRRPEPFAAFPTLGFYRLPIRGYPKFTYYTRAASVFALDYRFPLADIYRGWGTNPLFLQDLYGFTFAEATYFPAGDVNAVTLPSTGGGVRMSLVTLLDIPLVLSVEFHKGFRTDFGGANDLLFQIILGGLNF